MAKLLQGIKKFFGSAFQGGDEILRIPGAPDLPIRVPPVLHFGDRDVRIVKYIDEGGFSYVFKAEDDSGRQYALKRLMIQSREQLVTVRNEIDVMKAVCSGRHPNLVRFFGELTERDSDTGATVYWILMEFGSTSVLDIMNDRLASLGGRRGSTRHFFSDDVVLEIFYSVCCAVARVHEAGYQHRDVKVENVLLVKSPSRSRPGSTYKLCDFGSCTNTVYPATLSKRQRAIAEEDIAKMTTLEYRAPEMVDFYSGYEIGLQTDVWALGCLLYKLYYFIGPFDGSSDLQILSGKYDVPPRSCPEKKIPKRFLRLIKSMLKSDPSSRPTVYHLIQKVAALRGLDPDTVPKAPEGSEMPRPAATAPSPADSEPQQRPRKRRPMKKKRPRHKGLFDELDEKPKPSRGPPRRKPAQPEWEPQFDEMFGDEAAAGSGGSRGPDVHPVKREPAPVASGGGGGDVDLFDQLDWQEEGEAQSAPVAAKKSPPRGRQGGIRPPSPKAPAPPPKGPKKKVKKKSSRPARGPVAVAKETQAPPEDSPSPFFQWDDDDSSPASASHPTKSKSVPKPLPKPKPRRVRRQSQSPVGESEKKKPKPSGGRGGGGGGGFSGFDDLFREAGTSGAKSAPAGRVPDVDAFFEGPLMVETKNPRHRSTASKTTVPMHFLGHGLPSPSMPRTSSSDNVGIPRAAMGSRRIPYARFQPARSPQFSGTPPAYGHQDPVKQRSSSPSVDLPF